MGKYDTVAFDVLKCDRRYQLRWAKFPVIADAVREFRRTLGRAPRVLDVGIGRARIQQIYQHRYADEPAVWHGFDLHHFRLEQSMVVPDIHRVQGNLEVGLCYDDASFDVVISSWLLQHIADPEAAVLEMARVLRPGGLLVLAVPNSPQPLKTIREVVYPPFIAARAWVRYRRGWRGASYRAQIQCYNLPRVRRMVETAGLSPERWYGLGFVTGGPISFLENYEWYYELHLRLAELMPRVGQNLVCVARKPGGDGEPSPA